MKLYSKKSLIIRLVLSALIIIVGVLGFVFQEKIENVISSNSQGILNQSDFKMYVVDVGQGDSIFLEFSDSKNMLIDCGKKAEVSKLDEFLKSKNIKTINYFVYTHPDDDHVGGGYYIFTNYNIEVLYRPKVLSTSEEEIYGNPYGYNVKATNGKTYNNSIMVAYDEIGCDIRYSFMGEEIVGADYKIKFLAPVDENYSLFSNSNGYSAVIMVEVNGKKVLLTGDAESDIEEKLLTKYGEDLDSDVLKVSHHGSKTASSTQFLNIVTPDVALISAGVNNRWNMPHEEVIDRLNLANTKQIFTTNDGGTISLAINDSGEIGVAQNGKSYKFDMPAFLCVLCGIMLLTWGIVVIKKSPEKKLKKQSGKKNSKREQN